MMHDKNGNRRAKRSSVLLLLCLAAVLLISVGGTLAYLVTKTDPVENTFTPSTTDIDINEVFDNVTKKNVTVTNKSDFPVYVRATYVAYWVSDTDGSVLAEAPTLTGAGINTGNWSYREADGYWYYNKKLGAGETSTAFIVEMTAAKKEGCHLVIDVIAECVQAEPEQAVQDVWGFTPTTSN